MKRIINPNTLQQLTVILLCSHLFISDLSAMHIAQTHHDHNDINAIRSEEERVIVQQINRLEQRLTYAKNYTGAIMTLKDTVENSRQLPTLHNLTINLSPKHVSNALSHLNTRLEIFYLSKKPHNREFDAFIDEYFYLNNFIDEQNKPTAWT